MITTNGQWPKSMALTVFKPNCPENSLKQPPKSLEDTLLYWNRNCPGCSKRALVCIPGNELVYAELQRFNCCVSCTNMVCTPYMPKPVSSRHMDLSSPTKIMCYKKISRSDTTKSNVCGTKRCQTNMDRVCILKIMLVDKKHCRISL